jgi:hypothetical protein
MTRRALFGAAPRMGQRPRVSRKAVGDDHVDSGYGRSRNRKGVALR